MQRLREHGWRFWEFELTRRSAAQDPDLGRPIRCGQYSDNPTSKHLNNTITSFALSFRSIVALPVIALMIGSLALGQAPGLGSAAGFAVLGGTTVTNAGATTVSGDVGVAPGTALTGFPPGSITGTTHLGDPVAVQAQADAALAYNAVVAAVCGTTLTGQDLGGLTLTPGVYCFASAAQMTGTLTLDGLGDNNAVFLIKIGSTLTTAVAATVNLTNGTNANNVFWQIGSSATLAATTGFAGNLLALASITVSSGASVNGRLLALNAAVNMDTNSIALPSDATVASTGPGCGTPTPTLSALGLPTLGNPAFALTTGTAPNATVFLFVSFGLANVTLAPGCVAYLDGGTLETYAFAVIADGLGAAVHAAPVPSNPALHGLAVYWQAAEYVVVGPVFGSFAITNGLVTVLGT